MCHFLYGSVAPSTTDGLWQKRNPYVDLPFCKHDYFNQYLLMCLHVWSAIVNVLFMLVNIWPCMVLLFYIYIYICIHLYTHFCRILLPSGRLKLKARVRDPPLVGIGPKHGLLSTRPLPQTYYHSTTSAHYHIARRLPKKGQ